MLNDTNLVVVAANNDKTGYSLTAGSYSIRASSTQRGTVSLGTGDLSQTASISSVTLSRAHDTFSGCLSTSGAIGDTFCRIHASAGTTVTATRGTNSGGSTTAVAGFSVPEHL